MPLRLREKVQTVPRQARLTTDDEAVRVAAGILISVENRVLIADRLRADSMQDFREFPGGKVRPGEKAEEALHRELTEELGVSVLVTEHFHRLSHRYPDKVVDIDFFLVRKWRGNPVGREGQTLSWVRIADLHEQDLLPADIPVIVALQKSHGRVPD